MTIHNKWGLSKDEVPILVCSSAYIKLLGGKGLFSS